MTRLALEWNWSGIGDPVGLRLRRDPLCPIYLNGGQGVPYAVGVDIGCGVVLIETDLAVDYLLEDPPSIGAILRQVARDVPVGNGPQAQHRAPEGEPYTIPEGSDVLRVAMQTAEVQIETVYVVDRAHNEERLADA